MIRFIDWSTINVGDICIFDVHVGVTDKYWLFPADKVPIEHNVFILGVRNLPHSNRVHIPASELDKFLCEIINIEKRVIYIPSLQLYSQYISQLIKVS